jgi:hypothetical protein
MISRTLAHRLTKLEGRLAPPPKHGIVINFVAPGREVTGTLTFVDGREERWYAPGHEPENRQMSSGVLR